MSLHTKRFTSALVAVGVVAAVLPVATLPAAAQEPAAGIAVAQAAPTNTTVTGRVPKWPEVQALMPSFLQRVAVRETSELNSRITSLLPKRLQLKALGKNVAVRVDDLATGEKIFGSRAGRGMLPASTMKLATALAVLSARGKNYTLKTEVKRAPGSRRIVLVGGGDPLLTSTDIRRLANKTARAAKAATIPAKKFFVRYDSSLFTWADRATGWPSSYLSTYVARPSALMRDRRKVNNPAWDAAKYFRDRLSKKGLKVTKRVAYGRAPGSATTVASNEAHQIDDAVWRMLRYSDNTVAEVLIRHVAKARGASTSTWSAPNSVKAELAALGVPLNRAQFYDGSGLSRSNRLPANTLTGIVRASANPTRPDLSWPYRSWSVPVAGMTGTLYSRYSSSKTKCARGIVMAKTGTLSNVVALSGIAAGDDGAQRAFAIVVNNKPRSSSTSRTREAVDRLAATITGCR